MTTCEKEFFLELFDDMDEENLPPHVRAAIERKQILLRAYQSRMRQRREAEADGLIKMFFGDEAVTEREKRMFDAGYDVSMVYCVQWLREHFLLTPKPEPTPPEEAAQSLESTLPALRTMSELPPSFQHAAREEKLKLAEAIRQYLLEKKEREWDDVIIKKHFKGRSMSPLEKGIFNLGYALAMQNYSLYLRDNCTIMVKKPEEATQSQESLSPPIDDHKERVN